MSKLEELQIEHEKDLLALEQEIGGWKSTNRILVAKLEIAEKALETTYEYISQTDQELTKRHLLKSLQQLRS